MEYAYPFIAALVILFWFASGFWKDFKGSKEHEKIKLLLRNIFGHKEAADYRKWIQITTSCAKGLDEARQFWFDRCLLILKKAGEDKTLEIAKLKHTRLGDGGELAILAYQLLLASGFIAQHAYISRSHGKSFADLLYAQSCGTRIDEAMSFLKRYLEVNEDTSAQLYRVCYDVAKYITGSKSPLNETMVILTAMPLLVSVSHLALAEAFGDHSTAKSILKDAEKA